MLGAGQRHRDVRRTARPAHPDAAARRPRLADRVVEVLDRAGLAGQPVPLAVEHDDRAVQHVGHDVGHVAHAAAVQQHVGELVVGARGHLDGVGLGPHLLVGPVELLEEPGVLQGDGRVRGERHQQRHLPGREPAHLAVHREQRADHRALDGERDAEDRPDVLAVDRGVDELLVQEALVVLVVLGEVGLPGLRDQPEQAGAERQPEPPELRRERPVRHLHVRRPVGLVVQRQVGHVRVQQGAGPSHDRGEDRVDVADRGEVVGGLVERGHLRLALPLALHLLADPQRHRAVVAQPLERGAVHAVVDGAGDDRVEGLAGRLAVQQVEELLGH